MKQTKKKNIVWLHSHFLYWMGGTKFIFEVVKQLKDRYHIIVIVDQASEFARAQYRDAGVELIELHQPTSTSMVYWIALPFFIQQSVGQIFELFQTRKFLPKNTSVITSMFPLNVVATALQKYTHTQLCYEPFAFFYDEEFTASFSVPKRFFIWCLKQLYSGRDKHAVQQAAHVLTLNDTTKALVKSIYEVDATLTYAGVDLQLFTPFVSAKVKATYKKQKLVVHSTDYSPIKGTDRVIRAFKHVVEVVPNALLVITSTIKNEHAEQKLKALAAELGIEKSVEFAGFLPIRLLPQYYSLAWVVVQGSSSLKSGTTSMALPVKEAMACGTPAIRPNVGNEDVVDGKSGYVVDPRDTKLLAEKVIDILKHPKKRHEFGETARKRIIRTYTWKKTAARISAVL